jgi:hypothetical protein
MRCLALFRGARVPQFVFVPTGSFLNRAPSDVKRSQPCRPCFSLRALGRNPGLTATVLLTLALGTGANTAIFTVGYATLLAPLPYPEPNQLVMVWSKIQTRSFTRRPIRFRVCQ